jgi:hypothetical protein
MPAGNPGRLAGRALQRHLAAGALRRALHYREALPFRLTPLSGAARRCAAPTCSCSNGHGPMCTCRPRRCN